MIANVSTKHAFGLTAGVSGSVHYLEENTIVYPVGTNCVLYNVDQKGQKLIQCSVTGVGITAMAVTPNKRYVAIAEKGEKPLVSVYDVNTYKKRKTLSYPESQTQEFSSLAFSPDSKYLIAQGGRPDWTLVYWGWEKSKLMATFKTSPQQSNAVHQVYCICVTMSYVCYVNVFRYHLTLKITLRFVQWVMVYLSCSVTMREA